MGRRKIEIKAIKDDRNRSVTFLKRKGGLFKKAHELSVLCSVDVAVIIFGNNKKLYEYSSSDLGEILTRYQFYGGPNEHKGPADFTGKDKTDDDDDDDDTSIPSHNGSVEPLIPSQFQNQVTYQHIRHQTPSASPPVPSGPVFPHHQPQRQHTPQSQLPDKRPTSRNASSRTGSNLVSHISQPPNGYAYISNPGMYNTQGVNMASSHPHAIPPHLQTPSMQQQQQSSTLQNHTMQNSPFTSYPQPSSHPSSHPQLHAHQQQQIHHPYQEDQRKPTMPSALTQERLTARPGSSPQPSHQLPDPVLPDVEIKQEPHSSQQISAAVPVKRIPVKSRSIFTPIDESRSILSQHWASSTSKIEPPRNETSSSSNRLQSIENNSSRSGNYSNSPGGSTFPSSGHASSSSRESLPPRSSSSNSTSHGGGGGKRPVLKVQIPDEPSDEGSATADSNSSPNGTNITSSHSRQNGNTTDSLSSGLVLPPPSPSAGTLLSAGASGPPNPFARPPVTQNSQNNVGSNNNSNNNSSTMNGNSNNNSNASNGSSSSSSSNSSSNNSSNNNNNNNVNGNICSNNHAIDTPVSALPSRFMTNEFLPSPSSFYPEWNFRGGDGNTLPSPLNFNTPVLGANSNFQREDPAGIKEVNRDPMTKRTVPEDDDGQDSKRIKRD